MVSGEKNKSEKRLEKTAMNIVHQLMDLVSIEWFGDDESGEFVDWRQRNNDKMIDFTIGVLNERIKAETDASPLEGIVSLQLTVEQLKNLYDAIWQVEDCGPVGEGWPSAEVEELQELIGKKMNEIAS